MKKLLLLSIFCLSFIMSYGQGKIGYLSTSGSTSLNPQDNPIEANYKYEGLTNMTLSRGAGMVFANNSSNSYVGYLPAGGTRNDAIANNVYFEVKLNANTQSMYLKSLTAKLRTADAWTSADVTYRWHYRIGETGGFAEIGTTDVLLGFTDNGGDGRIEPTINLGNIAALQNVAPNTNVYLRLYAWGVRAKQENGTTDVTLTTRGFGFGKSAVATTELITVNGFLTEGAPVMASWNFFGINANTYASASVTSNFQEQWVKKDNLINAIEIERGVGLDKSSLNNSFTIKYHTDITAAPTSFAEAVTKQTYYAIGLTGGTNYTQILGYRMKLRGSTSNTARWQLILGDDNNLISAQSQVINLDNADVPLTGIVNAGVYFYNTLDNDNVAVVIPPGKKAELRLYLWGGSSLTAVHGLGPTNNANENILQIYGKTLTSAEYLQILPVNLTSFKATKQNNAVRLNWATASEKDNSFFNVLRAGDDKSFVSIAKVNGNGTTDLSKAYSLTDYRPLAGANYYKLSQTDLNGDSKEVGEVQHIQFDFANTALTVVQQDDQAVKAVLTAAKAEQASVVIYNVSGQNLYQAKLNVANGINQIIAPVTLHKGVYVLKIKTQSGETWQAKFVK